MEQDELIAIEVLQTINTGNPNLKSRVLTTFGLLSFTYEDLMSERKDASKIKIMLNNEERLIFSKLRRLVLSRKYSQKSRKLKKTINEILETDKALIINKAYELFANHPNMVEFKEFVQAISVPLTPTNF